jgi:hypothetical protein
VHCTSHELGPCHAPAPEGNICLVQETARLDTRKQQVLIKARQELEKRIAEHDKAGAALHSLAAKLSA